MLTTLNLLHHKQLSRFAGEAHHTLQTPAPTTPPRPQKMPEGTQTNTARAFSPGEPQPKIPQTDPITTPELHENPGTHTIALKNHSTPLKSHPSA